MEQLLVVGAEMIDFTGQDGNKIQGTRVYYLLGLARDEQDAIGYQTASAFAPASLWRDLRDVPGVYEAVWRPQPDRKTGKIVLSLVGVKFLHAFDLAAAFVASLAAD